MNFVTDLKKVYTKIVQMVSKYQTTYQMNKLLLNSLISLHIAVPHIGLTHIT